MQRGVHFDPLRLPLLGGCVVSRRGRRTRHGITRARSEAHPPPPRGTRLLSACRPTHCCCCCCYIVSGGGDGRRARARERASSRRPIHTGGVLAVWCKCTLLACIFFYKSVRLKVCSRPNRLGLVKIRASCELEGKFFFWTWNFFHNLAHTERVRTHEEEGDRPTDRQARGEPARC